MMYIEPVFSHDESDSGRGSEATPSMSQLDSGSESSLSSDESSPEDNGPVYSRSEEISSEEEGWGAIGELRLPATWSLAYDDLFAMPNRLDNSCILDLEYVMRWVLFVDEERPEFPEAVLPEETVSVSIESATNTRTGRDVVITIETEKNTYRLFRADDGVLTSSWTSELFFKSLLEHIDGLHNLDVEILTFYGFRGLGVEMAQFAIFFIWLFRNFRVDTLRVEDNNFINGVVRTAANVASSCVPCIVGRLSMKFNSIFVGCGSEYADSGFLGFLNQSYNDESELLIRDFYHVEQLKVVEGLRVKGFTVLLEVPRSRYEYMAEMIVENASFFDFDERMNRAFRLLITETPVAVTLRDRFGTPYTEYIHEPIPAERAESDDNRVINFAIEESREEAVRGDFGMELKRTPVVAVEFFYDYYAN